MKELKQILMDRIQNILQLQYRFLRQNSSQSPSQQKYQLLLQHKKNQRYRSIRQNDILTSLNSLTLAQMSLCEELYDHTLQICCLYNNEFAKYKDKPTVSMIENLRKLYCQFFIQHGYKHKCQHLNTALDKDTNFISPAMLMGWLSGWSKKIYSQLLQKQIDRSFAGKDKVLKPIPNSMTVALQRKKSFEFQKDNASQLSQISLSNRSNIYSYFLDELQSYYKMCGIDGIDGTYLKLIRKRFKKDQFLKPHNLSKVVDSLIQNSANREISNIMKDYQLQYYQKFPKSSSPQKNLSKIIQSSRKNVVLSPIKKRNRNITENDQTSMIPNPSKLLSPKLSEFQFLRPQQIEQKIKKLRLINQRSIKNNIQFPNVSKKIQIKNQIKFNQNNSVNLQVNTLKNQQTQVSLQQRLKQRDFLRCESIKFTCKLKEQINNYQQLLFSSKLESPSKLKKIISDQFQCEYDDRKLKIGKNFQISDLRVNNKLTSAQRLMIGQAE